MDLAFVASFLFACQAARAQRVRGAWRSTRQSGDSLAPGKGQHVFLVAGGHRGMASGFSGLLPFCFPSPQVSAAAAIEWFIPMQAALPKYACRGINRWTHTSALLRITQNRGNTGPSIAR